MKDLIELALESGNWGAFAFGIFGLIITGILGFLLRRPLMKQAVANEGFKAIQQGYESLLTAKDHHIDQLQLQLTAQDAYERILVARLRECEEQLRIKPT